MTARDARDKNGRRGPAMGRDRPRENGGDEGRIRGTGGGIPGPYKGPSSLLRITPGGSDRIGPPDGPAPLPGLTSVGNAGARRRPGGGGGPRSRGPSADEIASHTPGFSPKPRGVGGRAERRGGEDGPRSSHNNTTQPNSPPGPRDASNCLQLWVD